MTHDKRDNLKTDGWTDDEIDLLNAELMRRPGLTSDMSVRVADVVAARRWADAAVRDDGPGCAWAGAHRG